MKKFIGFLIVCAVLFFAGKAVLNFFGFFDGDDDKNNREPTAYEVEYRHNDCIEKATKCVYRNLSLDAMYDELMDKYYFTKDEIDDALKEVPLNFKYAATVRAGKILESGNFSKKEVLSKLTKEYKFTKKEAEYAVDNIEASWNTTTNTPTVVVKEDKKEAEPKRIEEPKIEEKKEVAKATPKEEPKVEVPAVKKVVFDKPITTAKGIPADLIRQTGNSKEAIAFELIDKYGYTQEQAIKELGKLDVDWYEVCLRKAVELTQNGVKESDLYYELCTRGWFRREEAKYACSKVKDYIK